MELGISELRALATGVAEKRVGVAAGEVLRRVPGLSLALRHDPLPIVCLQPADPRHPLRDSLEERISPVLQRSPRCAHTSEEI